MKNSLILQYSTRISLFTTQVLLPSLVNGQQSYCWEPCSFNCPRAGPRLCPPEGILTYYDCCPGRGCCQSVKWPNLIFLILIIFMLLGGCACCFFFLFTDARQRMFAKQNMRLQEQEAAANAAAAAACQPPPTGYIPPATFDHSRQTTGLTSTTDSIMFQKRPSTVV